MTRGLTAPLRHPTFRRLYAAQAISLVGTGISTVAIALLAYELGGADAGVVLGTVLGLKMLAYVTGAPLFSAFAHRLPRKSMMIALDLIRAALIVLLPFVNDVYQLYALSFVISLMTAGFTPAFQATVPDILDDDGLYTRALSLSQVSYDLEALLSPSLAAFALLTMSFDTLFFLDSVTFVISAALIASTAFRVNLSPERGERTLKNITFGIGAYLATPRLRGLLAFFVGFAMAHAMVLVNTVVIVRDRFGLGESDTAIAFAAAGAGSMMAAVLLPRIADRVGIQSIVGSGAFLLCLALALASLVGTFQPLLAVWFMIGAGGALINTQAGRFIIASCEEGDRPAFFAAHFALGHSCWLVGYPLAGWLASVLPMSTVALVLAAVVALSGVVGGSVWRSARVG